MVYQVGKDGDLWWTDDKREKHDGYSLVAYGALLKGWTVGSAAKPLQPGGKYHIDVVGDHGDDGSADFVPKDVAVQCPQG
jgi:hypothetical protein